MKLHTRARPAFTLLELLVVLAIIALLASITVSAVFRLQSGQKETNTNTHLNKIHMQYDTQFKAAIAKILNERGSIPQPVKEATKNADGTYDLDRAMAFHMKMRLRQEFPNSFFEARNGTTWTVTHNVGGVPFSYVYKPLKNYADVILDAADPNSVVAQEQQAAAMLFLILSQSRGGAAFNAEQIGPTALVDFPRASGGVLQLRVFVDAWGNPISFRRIADDDFPDSDGNGVPDIIEEMSNVPYVTAAVVSSGNRDPQDPVGRLSLPANRWFTDPVNGNMKQQCSNVLRQTNPNLRPYVNDPLNGFNSLGSWNRGPFIFSAGKDNNYRTVDDLYSFRLALNNRGN